MNPPVRVELGDRSYDIRIGGGLLADAGRLIAPMLPRGARRVPIIVDERVAPLHLPALEAGLAAAGVEALPVVAPSGEGAKAWGPLERVVETVLAAGIERGSLLIALGGGVIGDLAGFAAAIALRGIGFVQIPTTLLAQVDSSVGGKTGINSVHGKNLIGAFHQPRLVLADLDTLTTLPRRELLAGYAEVVKYGAIDRPDFFAWLEAHGEAALSGDRAALARIVRESVEAKAAVVAADEREAGMRALLNLGHTFGHALEAGLGYDGTLLHGEAVAIGMALAFRLSVRLGFCPPEDEARLTRHLAQVGLPTTLPQRAGGWRAEELLDAMGRDKKVVEGRIAFVLARGIGRAFVARDIDPVAVAELLDQAAAA